jgi:hypothetical protein
MRQPGDELRESDVRRKDAQVKAEEKGKVLG